MNIALIGYGKMGKEVEKTALMRNHHIALRVDLDTTDDLAKENLDRCDAVIEFSTPETAYNNIRTCLEAGVPVVSGTTGWLNRIEDIKNLCTRLKGTFFYSSNFSPGVYLFSRINEYLAKMMDHFPEYSVAMEETHHLEKKDRPSGTAISLAEDIIKVSNTLSRWTSDKDAQGKPGVLPIRSVRRGKVPGIHSIAWNSAFDEVKLTHTAKNRAGFALGAVMAAEFIQDKPGIFGMKDLFALE